MLLHLGLATASSTPAPIEVNGRAAIAVVRETDIEGWKERANGVRERERERSNHGNGGRLKHLLDS